MPQYLWRFPLMMIAIVVKRFGWKAVGAGWVGATILAIYLNYHF